MKYNFFGTHIMSDIYGIEKNLCLDDIQCKLIIEEAIMQSHAHVIKTVSYIFDSGGFTLISLLKEFHVSIHTYPESNAAFIDVFTCGNTDTQKIIDLLIDYFKPNKYISKKIIRGTKNTSF